MMRGMDFPLLLADQLGPHLKSLRKLRGLSQAQLGQRLGVGQARVAAIEANPGAVSLDQLLRILHVLRAEVVLRLPSSESADAPEIPSGTPALTSSRRGQW